MEKIVTISDRGQITIPKKVREQVPALQFSCSVFGEKIILTPLHVVDSRGNVIAPPSPKEPFSNKQEWEDLSEKT